MLRLIRFYWNSGLFVPFIMKVWGTVNQIWLIELWTFYKPWNQHSFMICIRNIDKLRGNRPDLKHIVFCPDVYDLVVMHQFSENLGSLHKKKSNSLIFCQTKSLLVLVSIFFKWVFVWVSPYSLSLELDKTLIQLIQTGAPPPNKRQKSKFSR